MTDAAHTEDYKGYRLELHRDPDAESPRENDNLGTMVCFHSRYQLGDHKQTAQRFGWGRDGAIEARDWLAGKLKRDPNGIVVLYLWLYDHSGITMRASEGGANPFNDPWDSGAVGFIYADRATLLKEYGGTRITAKIRARALDVLRHEVDAYDQYLTGDVYGYVANRLHEDGAEDGDSCWGLFGYDYAIKTAREAVDALVAA